jgi:hypothetical protein
MKMEKDWSYTTTAKEILKLLEAERCRRLLLPQGSQPCHWSILISFQDTETKEFFCLSTQFMVLCYCSPRELTYIRRFFFNRWSA